MLTKIIAQIFLIATSVLMSVLVMEYGWGLKPLSWGWIIGVGFGVQLLIQMLIEATKGAK